MFASKGIIEHLVRGIVGAGSVAAAVTLGPTQPWVIFVAIPVGLVAWRGCPTCWAVGLLQTLAARGKVGSSAGCVDGSCLPRRFDPRA